jgi:hypothetical protein
MSRTNSSARRTARSPIRPSGVRMVLSCGDVKSAAEDVVVAMMLSCPGMVETSSCAARISPIAMRSL